MPPVELQAPMRDELFRAALRRIRALRSGHAFDMKGGCAGRARPCPDPLDLGRKFG
jgi:hypothetical protein